MAAPGHAAYSGSSAYKKNFDRDVHADTGIFNRLKVLVHLTANTITLTGTTCFGDGSNAAPSINFCADPTTGLYRTATGNVAIADSAITVAQFDSATPHGLIVGYALADLAHITTVQLNSVAPSTTTGMTVTNLNANGTDAAGIFSFTDTAGGPGDFRVTYQQAYPVGDLPSVVITAADAQGGAIVLGGAAYVVSDNAGFTFNFTCLGGPTTATFFYQVMNYI